MKSSLFCALSLFAWPVLAQVNSDQLPLTKDSLVQEGVPKGELVKFVYKAKKDSIFPGTEREVTVYLPANLDKTKAQAFMVFQDGVIYKAPEVLNNLIHDKAIPSLIGIFVKPGVVPALSKDALPRFNRSLEYDTVNGKYAEFLIEELLPAIEKEFGLKLSKDPNDTAIAGSSSGGIAAWMVAWHRSDRFRRVFTSVGTYVGLRGGNDCASLVRKTEPKPIRLFLQDGTNDINGYGGSWWIANQDMFSAMEWAGYEVNHAWGDGGHNQKHASVVFPEGLRWLWKNWSTDKQVHANVKKESKWRGYEVMEVGAKWEAVSEATGPALALESDGAVTTTQTWNSRTVLSGGREVKLPQGVKVAGSTFSPDQSLFYYTLPNSAYVMSAQRQADDSLLYEQPFFRLHEHDAADAQAAGMCVDVEGRLYTATNLGIQVADQAGRVNFIIPTPGAATDVCFGGKDLQMLYIVAEGKLLKRDMKIKGVRSNDKPIKPAAPRL